MKINDWRGHSYEVGDLVLYPRMSGRSVEMMEATVVDIWRVFYNDSFEWQRLPEGERASKMKKEWNGETREFVSLGIPDDELRVKLQPTGAGSRFRHYEGVDLKPVVLQVTENITKILC